jgi:hypothetical protein
MHLTFHRFALPKAGNEASDYEDAMFPPLHAPTTRRVQRQRVAVADGATESSFARLWAELLVEGYGTGHLVPTKLVQDLPALQREWLQQVSARPLPWYAEEKVRDGAFAAWLGLELRDTPRGGRWRAFGVGDSCLCHLRGGELLAAFPLSSAAEFNNRPFLVGSRPQYNARVAQALRTWHGYWEHGDQFVLMTDALAAWFLATHEAGEQPMNVLEGFLMPDGADEFAAWVTDLRAAHQIRNDDTTLVRVLVTHDRASSAA